MTAKRPAFWFLREIRTRIERDPTKPVRMDITPEESRDFTLKVLDVLVRGNGEKSFFREDTIRLIHQTRMNAALRPYLSAAGDAGEDRLPNRLAGTNP